jgi:predicted RND superfamily exporter protein
MVDTLASKIIQFRWFIIIGTFAAVFFIASGASNIGFSSNYRVFFSEDNEQLVAFETLQNTYSKSDNIFVVLAPKDGEVFTVPTLSAVKDLTDRSWQLPYSTRVDSITNFQYTKAEEDDLLVNDLVEYPEDVDLDEVKEIALEEPLLSNRLISKQAHVTAVNTTVQLPQLTENEIPELVAEARKMLAQFENDYPHLDVYITGSVMLGNAFSESAQNDMANLFPVMFLIIVATLLVLLRSITGTAVTLIVIILSIATAMGMFGWLGWTLTGPSTSAPTVIMTMAVADCVHILVTFLFNMRHGMNKSDAMQESIRINFQPVFITSITTVVGFLTLNFSEVPPFHDLGNTVAMGVIAAFFLSVFLLPALVMVLPVKEKIQNDKPHKNLDAIATFVIEKRNKILVGTGILSIAIFSAIPLNMINDDFVGYFKKGVEFRQDTDFTADNLSGIYTIEYSLVAGDSGEISSPRFLQQVDAFAKWLEAREEVVHVDTITEIFKRLNKNMHGDDPSYHQLPDNKELAAQYLLLYEMSLPYGLDLNNQLNVDKSSIKVTVVLNNIQSYKTLRLEQEISDWLVANTDITEFYAASPNVMFSHIGQRNVTSMVIGVSYALVLICIIMIIVLRSFKLGLISLVPNLIPIGAAFGLWGIFNGNVGISVGTATGMILGIVVDDTVHFLSKYRRAQREKGYTSEQAVHYAFATVGTALWVTTFVLVAGFMVLALSDFNMNAHMGIFTATTITLALIFDFIALPAILLKIEERSSKANGDSVKSS